MERLDSDDARDQQGVRPQDGAPGVPTAAPHPEQEHPVQDAHGGSMAPGLVDDTGHLVTDPPTTDG